MRGEFLTSWKQMFRIRLLKTQYYGINKYTKAASMKYEYMS